MRFIILGSGGCVCTPKPLCQCAVCTEARKKSYPYARCGCSLYLEDIALLVDTPEDIAAAINNADIKEINTILYSHWDPDHTMGMRVAEQLRLEWLDYFDGVKPENPITVYAETGVMKDLNKIRSKYGPLLDYYESMKLIKRQEAKGTIEINDVRITFVPIPKGKNVSVFVFESEGKKLIYAPCDCLPFPDDTVLNDADMLIIGNTLVGETLKNGRIITDNHPIRRELYSMENILDIKKRLSVQQVIITHLEEDWGKSYDDYLILEKEYEGIRFAYDGMALDI